MSTLCGVRRPVGCTLTHIFHTAKRPPHHRFIAIKYFFPFQSFPTIKQLLFGVVLCRYNWIIIRYKIYITLNTNIILNKIFWCLTKQMAIFYAIRTTWSARNDLYIVLYFCLRIRCQLHRPKTTLHHATVSLICIFHIERNICNMLQYAPKYICI